MDKNQKPVFVKYSTSVDKDKKAIFKKINFPVDEVSKEDLEILNRISVAQDVILKILAFQKMPEISEIIYNFKQWKSHEKDLKIKKKINDYLLLIEQSQSVFNGFGDNFIFDESIKLPRILKKFEKILQNPVKENSKKNLYPKNFTKSDFEFLKDKNKNQVNSVIRKNDSGKFVVEILEDIFSEELKIISNDLKLLSKKVDNKSLEKYLIAKSKELKSGTVKSRIDSDKAWINLTSEIGFILSTGLETYIDKFKGVRGGACLNVYKTDKKYQKISEQILSFAEFYEKNAPWKVKNKVDKNKLPKLKFVNVYAFCGDYITFPMITIAQSLPNEDEVVKKYGTQNLVYVNIMKSKSVDKDKNPIFKNLFTKNALNFVDKISDISVVAVALHELGHTTGTTKYKENANVLFGEFYSLMEEARAELFSMFALEKLCDEKIITNDDLISGYYYMLESMLKAQEFEPKDHSGSRNMMFNYYLKNGGIVEINRKYEIVSKKFRDNTLELLKVIGDIKTNGEIDKFKLLCKKYINNDLQKIIKKATKSAPLGGVYEFEWDRNN